MAPPTGRWNRQVNWNPYPGPGRVQPRCDGGLGTGRHPHGAESPVAPGAGERRAVPRPAIRCSSHRDGCTRPIWWRNRCPTRECWSSHSSAGGSLHPRGVLTSRDALGELSPSTRNPSTSRSRHYGFSGSSRLSLQKTTTARARSRDFDGIRGTYCRDGTCSSKRGTNATPSRHFRQFRRPDSAAILSRSQSERDSPASAPGRGSRPSIASRPRRNRPN